MAPKTSNGSKIPPSTSVYCQMGSLRVLTWLGVLIGVLAPLFYILDQNVQRFFIFDTEHLHDLAKRSIATHGNDTRNIVGYIVNELHSMHPSNVNLKEEWIFNNAGGAMGAMYIIHASVTEYVIIFGTAVGTEGHTGRHTGDDYFHILTGTQMAYVPGEYEPEIYPPGSVHHLVRGTAKQYKMPDGCFALEYVRGWVPPMLFFGFADGLTSTLDIPTLWRTTWVTAREMIGNLLVGKF